jgi:hypothetical protein
MSETVAQQIQRMNEIREKFPATNIQISTLSRNGIGFGASALASIAGVPQVAQITTGFLNLSSTTSTYATLPSSQLKPFPGVKYSDFRSRIAYGLSNTNVATRLSSIRLDGASAALRGGSKAYAIAAASPAGAYSVFNLDGFGKTGYGWGSHDDPYAIRNDFTARSHVATKWEKGRWKKTTNPIERVTPFRGDRVNVIDFSKRTINEAYVWQNGGIAENVLGAINGNLTQDFIKFFFTGPKLQNGAPEATPDDIIVFRASISSLSDTFSPTWTPVTMIGRADPNYHYTGVTRELSLDFTVYATDRDEVKPIWRKLNALAGYTAPEYDPASIAMKAPWMRITIGDIYKQQPVIITSLTYTLHDADTTWEINIERDPTMMQVPHKVSVSLGLTLIPDYLPEKGGRFYTLTNGKFDDKAQPISGDNDWLSDTNPLRGVITVDKTDPTYGVERDEKTGRLKNQDE